MRSEHHNTTRKARPLASRALIGRLRKSVENIAGGTGLAATLGDGAAGLGLIGLLMVLFLGVYLVFRGSDDRADTPTNAALAETRPSRVVDGTLIAAAPPADGESAPAPQPAEPPKLDFGRDVLAFFRAHCYDCHTGENAEAGLVLDKYKDEAAVTGNRQAFAKILKMLRGGLMPPPDHAKSPPKDKREQVVAWLDWKLNFVDCGLARPRPRDDPPPQSHRVSQHDPRPPRRGLRRDERLSGRRRGLRLR